MSWRTVVITKRAKLDLRMQHMVVRMQENTQKIYLAEIELLMIETTMVSITSALLAELAKKKIKVIFCDETHSPISELVPYHACHDVSKKIFMQFQWEDSLKERLWKRIIEEKIKNQKTMLEKFSCGDYSVNLLKNYLSEVQPNDETNREGLAAKVYFNALFGKNFIRGDDTAINAALNYGYQIILSCFNREVKVCGYLTEIGIFHNSQHNPFNLSSDLMEPFRVLVDEMVARHMFEQFEVKEKRVLQNLLNQQVQIQNRQQYLPKAIAVYVKSVFHALNEGDLEQIKFMNYEL